MSAETYEDFTNLYEVPYTVVTLLYILALLVISAVASTKICKRKCEKCEKCFTTKISNWLVRIVFGKSEGVRVSENSGTPDARETKIYTEMNDLDINILGTIILCFCLLMAIAAYGVYLLEVTHTCSEDTAIYCFPQFISEDDLDNPNITAEEFQYPITDCSVWVNSSIAPKITFQCFRYAYNGQLALATAGGLLALFTVAMRITITIFLKCFKCCFKCCGSGCLIRLQVAAVIILLIFDVILAGVVMAFQLHDQLGMTEREQSPVAQQTASYLADNGLQFLVIMGTATLLLLISWEEYANKENKKSDGENGSVKQSFPLNINIVS